MNLQIEKNPSGGATRILSGLTAVNKKNRKQLNVTVFFFY